MQRDGPRAPRGRNRGKLTSPDPETLGSGDALEEPAGSEPEGTTEAESVTDTTPDEGTPFIGE